MRYSNSRPLCGSCLVSSWRPPGTLRLSAGLMVTISPILNLWEAIGSSTSADDGVAHWTFTAHLKLWGRSARLTLKLHPGRFDLDLVSRPVVGIAKGVFDRLPVGAIEHHGADVAFKVQNVFFLRVFSFTDLFPLDVRDHRDAGLVLYVGTFEVLAWESFICAHFEISYESMHMLRFVFVFSLITVLLGAPPLGTCVLCAR